jgi:uncharacterized protein YyaL (SSP411 family)
MAQLQRAASTPAPAAGGLSGAILDQGFEELAAAYEPDYGGFGSAPKFPRPVVLDFLLRYHARTGSAPALSMTLHTLRKMAAGGMHDHLGGGFHRYSVDREWHVPHFEKMLYDQAQLACSYLDAFQLTQDPFFADVARSTLDYVLRDLRGDQGQFHSAEDADSPLAGHPGEHAEGAFYVWSQDEVTAALGAEAAEVFCTHYGVESRGNVASDPQGEFRGRNVLRVRGSMADTARQLGRPAEEVQRLLAQSRAVLFAARTHRPRPHLDDKALTGWNGLMISALARAVQVLDEPRYLAAAEQAAGFCQDRLYDPARGRLLRRYRAGEAAIDGYAEDYACLIQGLLDLYEAAFDPRSIVCAEKLQRAQDELFSDPNGGYYSTSGEDPTILLRLKEDYDGAEPSATSVSALNLLRLAQFTGNDAYRIAAEKALASCAASLARLPSALPQMLVALDHALAAPQEVVIAGTRGAADTRALLRALHAEFAPRKVLLLADGGAGQEALAASLEFVRGLRPIGGKATAYLCENHTCQLPTTDPELLRRHLRERRPTTRD